MIQPSKYERLRTKSFLGGGIGVSAILYSRSACAGKARAVNQIYIVLFKMNPILGVNEGHPQSKLNPVSLSIFFFFIFQG
jgi:hypothetical protein